MHAEDHGLLLFLLVYPLISKSLLYSVLGYFGTLVWQQVGATNDKRGWRLIFNLQVDMSFQTYNEDDEDNF